MALNKFFPIFLGILGFIGSNSQCLGMKQELERNKNNSIVKIPKDTRHSRTQKLTNDFISAVEDKDLKEAFLKICDSFNHRWGKMANHKILKRR